MVDNTTLPTGVGGDTIATDDIGGVKFQRVKLIHGADGVNAGDVAAANGLPVQVVAGSAVIGALVANQSVNAAQINGIAPLMGNGISGTGSQRVNIASDNTAFAVNATLIAETTKVIGTVNVAAAQTIAVTQATPANLQATVTNLALTKGTQGATGVSTQDLKDAGRVAFSAATVIAGVTAVTVEALVTLVPVRAGTAAATATSQAVTAAKRLRITSITIGFISTAAAVLSMRFALRTNPAGAATATSPILHIIPLSSAPAVIQQGAQTTVTFPDGLEFSGTEQFGITQIGSAISGTLWISVSGFEY